MEGADRAESRACACALNFTIIGMYKENVSEIVLKQGLILVWIFGDLAVDIWIFLVCTHPSRFLSLQSFSKKSTQVLVHDPRTLAAESWHWNAPQPGRA